MKTLKIVHLYPKEMNIYGDNGNLNILFKRLEWRDIKAEIIPVGVGDNIPKETALIVGGGGQDAGQSLIQTDLMKKKKDLVDMANNGLPMLMICGMYQMFGHYFKTQDGGVINGLGILDVQTVAGNNRLIGNIVVETEFGSLIGYENHSGLTTLNQSTKPLGTTAVGQGNNLNDGQEGARYKNVFATYLHGPVLAKNPVFADFLLKTAIDYAGIEANLTDLDEVDQLSYLTAAAAQKLKR